MKIIPAILTSDPEIFQTQLRQVESLTDIVHIDICDGLFVPEKTVDPELLKSIQTPVNFSLHLMVQNPISEIEKWYNFPNLKRIIFHLETTKIPSSSIEHIEAYGYQAGVAVNPETTLEQIGGVGYQADSIFFLSVPPGKQGQKFMPEVLEKLKLFKEKHPNTAVGIDGGIHLEELNLIKNLDIDYVIMGSEIFSHPDPTNHLKELQELIKS
ncbi:MAG TPA: hypothetical protein PKY08_01900 [Candidatus Magasanikbacteria bacterium]|nr:hypothetical protein [Candidatus Magasanikbacteria bacterium]